jgi:hypothetical protein
MLRVIVLINCKFTVINCKFTLINCTFTLINCKFTTINSIFTLINCNFTFLKCKLKLVSCEEKADKRVCFSLASIFSMACHCQEFVLNCLFYSQRRLGVEKEERNA